MLERFTAFLKAFGKQQKVSGIPQDETALAAAALALAVIRADGLIEPAEEKALEAAIRENYRLDHPGFDALLAAARLAESDATDHYRFASHLRRHLDEDARGAFIDMLWTLVGVDGKDNEIEGHMVWRIAEMIGVSGRDRNSGGTSGPDASGSPGDRP